MVPVVKLLTRELIDLAEALQTRAVWLPLALVLEPIVFYLVAV